MKVDSKQVMLPSALDSVSPENVNKSKKELSPEELAKQKFKMQQAEQVAQDFETMFMDLILKSMRQTAKPEDASNAQDIYQGMLDSEYAKSMTTSQDFGIRSMVLDWMKNNDPELTKINQEGLKALQEMEKSKNAMKYAADQYKMQMLGGK